MRVDHDTNYERSKAVGRIPANNWHSGEIAAGDNGHQPGERMYGQPFERRPLLPIIARFRLPLSAPLLTVPFFGFLFINDQ